MVNLVDIVKRHPNAVFVKSYGYRTFRSIKEDNGFYRGGSEIIRDLLQRGDESHKEILLKPNVVAGRTKDLRSKRNYHGGIVTNARFIAGMLDELYNLGESNITIVDGGVGQGIWSYYDNGYTSVLTEPLPGSEHPWPSTRERRGVRLAWTNKYRFSYYREDELTWVPVPDGVLHKEFPVVAPIRKSGTILLSAPTLKTHNLGVVTLCCKGLQGVIASGYKHFCAFMDEFDDPKHYPPEVLEHFQPNFRERVIAEYERHLKMGLPLWDSNPDKKYGIGRFEAWAQRVVDAVAAFTPYEEHFLLNVVEGIIGRDGTAFNQGKDVPVGSVVAGINPVHVDAVASFLMGHDPRYVPFLVIANERGLGENDMNKIEIFSLPDMKLMSIEELARIVVPLPVYLHRDTTNQVLFNEKFFTEKSIKFVPYKAVA